MFGSFVGMLSKLKQNRTVQTLKENLTENYNKLKEQVLRKYEIIEVLPQIFHIQFPQPENVSQLTAHIAGREFQIWNVSEYRYESGVQEQLLRVPEQGEIRHLCFSMYSNLPFYQLVLAIDSIHRFTQRKDTGVYVHCQDSRIRSALLLACYIYRHRLAKVQDISQAILFVNRVLGVRLDQPQSKMHRNMHVLLRNFVNYFSDFHSINKCQLKLLKIIINGPPLLAVRTWTAKQSRISVEIKCGESSLFKNIYTRDSIEGNILCVSMQKRGIVLSDQFLLVVKYLQGGKAYNVIRIQLNTNFIYDCFSRVQQQDIDTSEYAQLDANNPIYVDFMFESSKQFSALAQLENGGLKEEPIILEKSSQKKEQVPQKELQIVAPLNVQSQSKKQQNFQSIVHSQAMASLKEVNLDIGDEDCTTIDLVEQINQKLSLASKPAQPRQTQQSQKEQQQQQEQDFDDYLSKLQSQA